MDIKKNIFSEVIKINLEYISKELSDFRLSNKEDHIDIVKRLDYTNGKVRGLQIWKASIAGALIILGSLIGYFINDYSNQHEQLVEIAKIQALNVLRLTELEKQ